MQLIDIHCHLDSTWFKDIEDLVKRSKENNVKVIIASGIDQQTNKQVIELAEKYDIIECSIGIYPIDALRREYGHAGKKYENFDVEEEIEFIRKNKDKIVGIGEVGLDFADENSQKEDQKALFIEMIRLAKELELPLIVHSRKAEDDVINLLEKEQAKKVILHCFCGKKTLIKRAAELGYSFSIPANVKRSSSFQTIVKLVNINQLLTETDSPYLAPVKDETNEPKNVEIAIEKIAEIKGFEKEEVANNIFLNYQRLFK